MLDAPPGLAVPLRVAAFAVTLVADPVVTLGTVGVLNDRTAPNDVPSELAAMAQKYYVVAGDRPETD